MWRLNRQQRKGSDRLPEFVIPDEIKDKTIDDVGFKEEVVLYLRKHKYKTIRDVIDKQDKIPNNILTSIKGKLIFNVDI